MAMKDIIILVFPIICGGIVIWDNFGRTRTKEFIMLTCTAVLTAYRIEQLEKLEI